MIFRNTLIFILIVSTVSIGYFLVRSGDQVEEEQTCTLEAKICPDGSSVGRLSPRCEFAPCPSVMENPASSEKSEAPKASYRDLIRVETPLPESNISSPLLIRGEARGSWYFEARFPVVLTDWDGRIIAQGIAEAHGDWMTTEYVPFTALLQFTPDTRVSERGSLILEKSNPSGLSENGDAFEFSVSFEK